MKPLFLRWDLPNNPYLGHVYTNEDAAVRADIRDAVMTVWASHKDVRQSEHTKEWLTCYFNAANLAVRDLHGMVDD